MGIIFRQSFKSTIYSVAGAVIGFLTVGILMTRYLTPAEIGLRMQIQSYAVIISSFLALGLPKSLVRMFPHFKNSTNNNHGVLSLAAIMVATSSIIFVVLFHLFGSYFLKEDIENSVLFSRYYSLIIPFTIATLIFKILDSYATAQKESTIGVFVKDVALRVFILIVLVGYIFIDIIDFSIFINTFAYLQFAPVILIILFLHVKKLLQVSKHISFPSNKIKNELISVSLYSWVNVLSAVAIITIDTIMLSKLTNSESVGIYNILFFFSGLMLIPVRSLEKIINSIVASHFKDKNFDAIQSIFKKSALNPFIIGLFLFGNLMLLIPFIFNVILNSEYEKGIWALIFLAIANLVKMSSGMKFVIISNSKYYRWITVLLIGFVTTLILTNFIFIPKYGIVGAALASLISNVLYQIAGLTFVKVKLNLWPFEFGYIKHLVVFTILGVGIYYLPHFDHIVIASVLKAILFSILFSIYIAFSKASPELDEQISLFRKKINF